MVRFFEYPDKEMNKEIDRLVEISESKPTNVKKDTTVYANNNLEKPFSMAGAREREVEKIDHEALQLIFDAGMKEMHHLNNEAIMKVCQAAVDTLSPMTVWEKIRSWLPGNPEATRKRIVLGIAEKTEERNEDGH